MTQRNMHVTNDPPGTLDASRAAGRDPDEWPGGPEDFEEFVLVAEPPLRRALVTAYGYEDGREAAAEALAS